MLRSSLCDYSNVHIPVSGTITITVAGNDDAARRLDERNKVVIFKNFSPFTDCVCEISNTQLENERYIDVVMPMYNLIQYSDDYSKTSGGFWQYYQDDPNDNITPSESFKCNVKMTEKSPAAGNTKILK